MAKFSHYAIAAARQAINDAQWMPETEVEKQRTVSLIDGCKERKLIVEKIGCLYRIWNG
jgi:3-oxoacyl-(acyl-carrier-protein) synthase